MGHCFVSEIRIGTQGWNYEDWVGTFYPRGAKAADFSYVRWMGPRVLTEFSRIRIDRDRETAEWAAAFEILRGGVGTIYGYFNNHYQGHSPGSANLFKRLIGQAVVDPESLVEQPSLF
jgi:uncharacterized protein YecE (DUF72 family)